MKKLDNAYKSIGEVAKLLNLVNKNNGSPNTHTIRFWEKEFKQIKPKIFSGRRRYYDDNSILILKKIHFLLKEQGMTINGVKKLLNNNKSLKLDEMSNNSISDNNNKIKNKLKKILNLAKELKQLK
ncbi:MAG: transcriptional regulator [Pelagibacteraceae bacterium TMED268]|nr:MAG: transcriptional regulator [Pelagibacteraceae bacterium TMED268]|tara:strand:- start:109 stop:486 length:378 start_codon:yes stop_codon:yes gene_type:complete